MSNLSPTYSNVVSGGIQMKFLKIRSILFLSIPLIFLISSVPTRERKVFLSSEVCRKLGVLQPRMLSAESFFDRAIGQKAIAIQSHQGEKISFPLDFATGAQKIREIRSFESYLGIYRRVCGHYPEFPLPQLKNSRALTKKRTQLEEKILKLNQKLSSQRPKYFTALGSIYKIEKNRIFMKGNLISTHSKSFQNSEIIVYLSSQSLRSFIKNKDSELFNQEISHLKLIKEEVIRTSAGTLRPLFILKESPSLPNSTELSLKKEIQLNLLALEKLERRSF